MFRQISVHEDDRKYQKILWRSSSDFPIQEFALATVTYGTTSAPYLAMRVLRQLADDEGHASPLAASILRDMIFVDDVLFGAHDLSEVREIRNQLVALLRKGGFNLRKWTSNAPELLNDIEPTNHGLALEKAFDHNESVRILGLAWSPGADVYRFSVIQEEYPVVSKRVVLSIISRLFDPLGWLAPVVIVAKVFMQSLWKEPLEWDTDLPLPLRTTWDRFYASLPFLTQIEIPRWIGLAPGVVKVELHGFSDASSSAYAAVVYARIEDETGRVTVSLLSSKTKVAPIKQLTTPRLELNGACLLARLTASLSSTPEFASAARYSWTDATIVIAWLGQQSSHWRTFVGNRVSEIHTLLPEVSWRHVPGPENPDDLASRGLPPQEIISEQLWWHGPPWLSQSVSNWPTFIPSLSETDSLEEKTVSARVHLAATNEGDIASRFSSWPRLLRVTVYIFRWLDRYRRGPATSHTLTLNEKEIEHAKRRWISLLQTRQFPKEIHTLRSIEPIKDGTHHLCLGVELHRESPLRRLNPFLDADGLLRVGGRLGNSTFDENRKHPYILRNDQLTRLIVLEAHKRCLHGGIMMTLATLRNNFWMLQARKLVRSVIYRCVTCARIRAELPSQIMSALPECRVSLPARPFINCGIDYAGPISVRVVGGRGIRSHKAYVAVFVCMAIKAVHQELVCDYSTAAFLAAFYRFCSRRGLPRALYNDRGTNFKGADEKLRNAYVGALAPSD
ncbi:PREDICTED: uncharacterized protein LOC108774572 [Cyphomyrmex costatus]|uniref:uncharacterized protein LOC108774572 n=1 Tax=Cyphomyrmex costatus TaxID=456900 RepID=UPI0008524052|nr:PREDICTED: uncharacterized protein LOC108774572 [Cyphomyrmex costatus]